METGRQFDNEALVGAVFADRYRVTRLLSEGANTVIFDADDLDSQRPVTIKVVQPGLAVSASFRDRFDRTIRGVAALSHPNIAAIFDWGVARLGPDPTVYVATERLTAGSLRDLYDRGRRLSPSQALAVGLEACRGLDHAHRRGFVHGELTPSKLVFGDDRRLRIVDFGLAALLGERQWEDPSSLSTHVARYASPEQALSLPIDGTTDVYALCLTLVEGVTGQLPFAADSTVATLAARVGKLMPVSADLGPLASVLERAGRPEAHERSSAAQFGRSLVQAAEKLPRPEPLPLLATGLFETPPETLRDPDDPTGGVTRGQPADLRIVVSDEVAGPTGETDSEPPVEAAGGGAIGAGVVVAGAGAVGPGGVDVGDGVDAEDAVGGGGGSGDAGADDALLVLGPMTGPVPSGAAAASLGPPPGAVTAEEVETVPGAGDQGPVAGDPSEGRGGGSGLPEDAEVESAPLESAPAEAAPIDLDLVVLDVDDPAPSGPLPAVAGPAAPTPTPVPTVAGPDGSRTVPVPTAAGPETSPTIPVPTAVIPEAPSDAGGAPGDEGRRRRRGRGVVAVVVVPLLVLAALVATVFVAVQVFSTPSYDVPDLVGLEQDVALLQIIDFEWDLQIDTERSDDEPRADHVIRTVPAADERLARGEPFLLVVSEGPLLRTLPELTDLNVVEAVTRLEDLAIVAITVERFDEVVPLGRVIGWSVVGAPDLGAGAEVEPGVEIELVASLGPEPRVVPDFEGAELSTVVTSLAQLGLVLAIPEEVFDDDVPAGSVIAQEPAAGAELERGGEVSVVISLGPDLVPVPDVVGLPFPEAFRLVVEAGLEPILWFGATDGEVFQLSVDGELVSPGTLLRRGSQLGLSAI